MKRAILGLALLAGCHDGTTSQSTPGASLPGPGPVALHSSSMALSADDRTLYVANADADSISVLDVESRKLVREIPLGAAPPGVDPATDIYTPAVMPRALALSGDGKTLFATGERAGRLFAIDVATLTVRASVEVGSEPVGVLASPDGASVFVAVSQEAAVVRVDAASMTVAASATVPFSPWGLAWSPDRRSVIATHLLGPGLSIVDPRSMSATTAPVPDVAPRGERRLANGEVRALYDVVPRPGVDELWVVHLLLATQTAQPDLDFESTAFPALSVLGGDGGWKATLSTDAPDVAGVDGAFADVVSGPHALAFTHDGAFALVVDTNSADVLVVDAARRVETSLLRPLPGLMPEGIVLSSDDRFAYVDQRNTGDVAILRIARDAGAPTLTVDGVVPRLAADPMPAALRKGQWLFHSADSDTSNITKNHWIACSTCHTETRSDAVTWRFLQGPRDTPSNAGGTLGTGFLLRTADRTKISDYWHTINDEQGGTFDPERPADAAALEAITNYVNHGIPFPVPPRTDAALVARGKIVFESAGCATCHTGPRFTDSGAGNATLDLAGPVMLHDVGTCVLAGEFPDIAHDDAAGHPRKACELDSPSLRGVASSPPYLHDGSSPTLRDAVRRMITGTKQTPLSAADEDALVEYLRSL
jgi:YVTN family beta-propeller protein